MRRLDGAYSIVALSEGTLDRVPRSARLPPARARKRANPERRLGRRVRDVRARPRRRRVRARGRARRGGADRRQRAALACRRSSRPTRGALCIFEFFYLARPDTRLAGIEVHGARVRMGERLADEAPADVDLVLPIPDSGTPAAIGFSRALGIPFSEGLIKNRYVGRTFIQPDQELRRPGRQAEVQPARGGRGQARRRRRRLDRPRQHDAADRADALRRGRDRGARAHLVAAGDRAVLLRHRPRRSRRDDRGRQVRSRRSREYIGATSLAYLSHDGLVAVDAAPRVGALPRVPHARLPDGRPGEQRSSASNRKC